MQYQSLVITSENASELSKLANKVRWEKWREKRDKKIAEETGVIVPEHPKEIAESGPLDYTEKTLARVRMQLDLVNERLTEQLERKRPDPQAIDRLASAQSRLSEQERILAGRPTPGALRPSSKGGAGRKSYAMPAPQKSQPASQNSQADSSPQA